MAGKFEIFKDKKQEFRFRLKASNGKIIASSEGYTERTSCLNGIESVKRFAAEALIIDLTKQVLGGKDNIYIYQYITYIKDK